MNQYLVSLSSFEKFLDETIQYSWSALTYEEFIGRLGEKLSLISKHIIAIGDHHHQLITKGQIDQEEELKAHVITYRWADLSKSFLLLWRDILFQHQKSQLFYQDKRLEANALNELREASRSTILKAAEEWQKLLPYEIQQIKTSKGGSAQQLFEWSQQNNPWPVYREQIEQIGPQVEQLLQLQLSLLESSEGFQQIRQRIVKSLSITQDETDLVVEVAEKAYKYILEHIEEKPARIRYHLEELESQLKSRAFSQLFIHSLDKQLETLGSKMQVPVATQYGIIQYKDVNFQRNARQWLESEILPLLNESWELLEQYKLNLKMSLVNIRNRVDLLAKEESTDYKVDLVKKDISQPLQAYLGRVKIWKERSLDLKQQLLERLKTSFYISTVYESSEAFLPVPAQSTITQLKQNQNLILARLLEWWEWIEQRFTHIKTSIEKEESLSQPEKIVRFLRTRTLEEANNEYTSIFLTKGQIGKSFWVGRVHEIERVKTLYKDWMEGYRGAILLSGQRYSGRTLFGELIANEFFDEKTLRVSPGETIQLAGRSIQCEYNLEPVLEFIQKHSLQSRPLVWIDDVELWRDIRMPLSQNIRVLQEYIDQYSSRIFFLVSTTNWSKSHLHTAYQLCDNFQAEINLDRMRMDEISQAILVRHGATHKTLVDLEDTEEMSSPAFKKLMSYTYKTSEGNIGEALNQWAYCTHKYKDNSVIYQPFPSYPLPDFLTPDTALLLTSIMMRRQASEYQLRKYYGPSFNEKYATLLQRLVRMGVLVRHLNGELEIHRGVVNDIGKLLERKNYLKFHH